MLILCEENIKEFIKEWWAGLYWRLKTSTHAIRLSASSNNPERIVRLPGNRKQTTNYIG